jgi:hypothetical protein
MSFFIPKFNPLQGDEVSLRFSLTPLEEQNLDREAAIQDVAFQISRTPSPALGRTGRLSFEEEEMEIAQPTPAYYLPENLFEDPMEPAAYPRQDNPIPFEVRSVSSTPPNEEASPRVLQPLTLGTLRALIAPSLAPLPPSPEQMDLRERVSATPSGILQPTLSRVASLELQRRRIPEEVRHSHKELQYLKMRYLDMRIHPQNFPPYRF